MDTTDTFRLGIFAAHNDATNRILAQLRQAGLSLTASPWPGPDLAISELQNPRFSCLLLLDEGSLPTAEIFSLLAASQFTVPLILAQKPEADTVERQPTLDCLHLSWTHDSHVITAIRQAASLQKALSRSRHLEYQLQEMSRSRELLLGENLPAIALVREGRLLQANTVFHELLRCHDPRDLQGKPLADFFRQEDRDKVGQCLSMQLPDNEDAVLVSSEIHGGQRFVLHCTSSLYQGDVCTQVMVRPAPANPSYARQKASMQHQDLVTRLDNLPYFQTRLESAIDKALNLQTSSLLLVVRFENYMALQDRIGRTGTGKVLMDISEFLHAELNRPFTACRLSDNEFAVLLFDTTMQEGTDLIDFINRQINNALMRASEHQVNTSATIGVATINEFSLDSEAMICRARSNAVIDAKGLTAVPDMGLQLKSALQKQDFRLLFQPLVSFHDNTRHRYEVLVRMTEDDGALKSPAQFMPRANLENLGEAIDKTVLGLLFSRPRLFAAEQNMFFIHVSSNTLANLTLLPWLHRRLHKNRFLSDKLVIQISELDYLYNSRQVLAFADCLAKLNLPLALTSFGNTMDPLVTMSTLKPALVRLDHSLTRELPYSMEQQRSIRKLIQQAHARQIQVAVTRIEDLETLPLFWDLGVDYVEGYSIQPPDSRAEFSFPQKEVIDLNADFSPRLAQDRIK